MQSRHGNNFNLLRFIFAGLVILSHAPEVRDGDRHEELLTQFFGTLSFGEFAVDCFFILSGFLILKSWHEHPDILGFTSSRVLRIYPGFVAASLICALIIGPLFGASSYFDDFQWKSFFTALLRLGFRGVPNTFQGSHEPTVNAAVWTIPYEFKCYMLVLALGATGLIKHRSVWPTILLLCTCTYLANVLNFVRVPFDFYVRFLMAFSAGACFYLYRPSIPWSNGAAALATVLCAIALFFKPLAEPAACTFGAYAILHYATAGQSLLAFNRLPDISYGVYLYAWPINKIVLWYFPTINVTSLILAVLALSIGAGTISWYTIERPFIHMKRRFRLQVARTAAISEDYKRLKATGFRYRLHPYPFGTQRESDRALNPRQASEEDAKSKRNGAGEQMASSPRPKLASPCAARSLQHGNAGPSTRCSQGRLVQSRAIGTSTNYIQPRCKGRPSGLKPENPQGCMKKVSILVPTYNGARHIRPAIDSVLSQANIDLELIVVDDQSTDGTAEIVESYDDTRIRVVRNPSNLGPEGNWNRALELATGEYVKLLPQDDLLQPGSLAKQVEVLESDTKQEIALVFGSREIIGPTGRILARRGLKGAMSGRIPAAKLLRDCVRRGTNVIGEPGAILFRRSLAQKVGRFDGQQGYVIDLDYWIRLLAYGDAWYLEDPVSSFRVSGGSWSVAIGRRQSRQYTDFIARMNAAGLVSGSRGDMAIGKVTALANNALRLIFYRMFVR